jgi:hypothetical protein
MHASDNSGKTVLLLLILMLRSLYSQTVVFMTIKPDSIARTRNREVEGYPETLCSPLFSHPSLKDETENARRA